MGSSGSVFRSAFGSGIFGDVTSLLDDSLTTDPIVDSGESWGTWDARRVRYRVAWALYEQTVYLRLTGVGKSVKSRYDLDDAIRSIYSPGYRIGEFWAEHLYPGQPDPDAGDGATTPSSTPILITTGNPAIRGSLKALWADSHIADELETFARYGAVLADVFLKVVDDPWRKKLFLQTIHPGMVREFTADPVGNCRGYVIEKAVADPEHSDPLTTPPLVTYTEEAYRQGQAVVYRTYRNGVDYDWRDYATGQPRVGPFWTEPYGFIPLVRVRHRIHAAGWGAGEYHFSLSKLMELDSLVSRLCDQVYKVARAPWYFEGGKVDDMTLAASSEGEDAYPMLGGDGKPHALVAPLSIADVTALAQDILAKLELDHPELASENVGLAASAETRRVAREKAEGKVIRRRANYDAGLIRAHQMALSMGGLGKYPGYEWIDESAFISGDLDHAIGPRPVFTLQESSRLQDEEQRGKTLKALTDGGVPLGVAMRRAGFPREDIAEAIAERDGEAVAAVERARSLGFHDPGLDTSGLEPTPAPTLAVTASRSGEAVAP